MRAEQTREGERHSPFLQKVRGVLRVGRYSYATEKTYIDWIVRFICYHGKRHPAEMGAPEVKAFLTHLALDRNVSPSTQTQALCALVFLYNAVHQLRAGATVRELQQWLGLRTNERIPPIVASECVLPPHALEVAFRSSRRVGAGSAARNSLASALTSVFRRASCPGKRVLRERNALDKETKKVLF